MGEIKSMDDIVKEMEKQGVEGMSKEVLKKILESGMLDKMITQLDRQQKPRRRTHFECPECMDMLMPVLTVWRCRKCGYEVKTDSGIPPVKEVLESGDTEQD